MNRARRRHFGTAPRSGFTLIELMVVMGVIAVLIGLSTMAIVSFVTNARHAATETVIKKVDAMMQDRMSGIAAYFEESNRRATSKLGQRIAAPSYVDRTKSPNVRKIYQGLLGNPANADLISDWEIIAKKFFRRKHFPMTFAEADLNNDGVTDVTNDSGTKITLPLANHTPETENAEVLYWFLTNGSQFGNEPVGTGDFAPSEVADTDGDGLLEIVDGWGHPLRFYRWPTRLFRPQTAGNESTEIDPSMVPINTGVAAVFLMGNLPDDKIIDHDPEDPQDDLRNNVLKNPQAGTGFTPQELESYFHTMLTWHAPLIMSAGEDGELGLLEPTNTAQFGNLAQPDYSNLGALEDNVSNLYLRTGGK